MLLSLLPPSKKTKKTNTSDAPSILISGGVVGCLSSPWERIRGDALPLRRDEAWDDIGGKLGSCRYNRGSLGCFFFLFRFRTLPCFAFFSRILVLAALLLQRRVGAARWA